ncbi:MAG: NADH:ubiquinone oxidoreductase [Proteobacteria bacterium]|nr:NADH:ubiquinone oxidoreductase [Pseudomonadota bacterium]MBU1687209.1 NADH:ubiquinone oxidoreductase [Pseudomonadota bacterium]
MGKEKTYLGVPVYRPRVAFFEFTSCEGCQLQILNREESLLDFLNLVEIVDFREAMTEGSDDYEIAFVEGCISRDDEVVRLQEIRQRAKVLVALGSCACFGGVNQLKNRFLDQGWVHRQVYGEYPIASLPVRSLADIVTVDVSIFGCPIKKEEVEKIVTNIALGKSIVHPKYPVCMECQANENICLFDLGEPCLGPVTRAGCDSWCPNNRAGCWGCRGPADDADPQRLKAIMVKHGFSLETIIDRLDCFGGFVRESARLRDELENVGQTGSVDPGGGI